jgi:streptomycin 6-kinase
VVDVIPAALRRNALIVWGADGAAWLDRLPALIDTLTADWDLDIGEPFVLSYHWVAPAVRADGTAVVVKLGVPGRGHLVVEAAALREYDGQGAVRLLAFDEARGALLLERADPGTPATALVPGDDAGATDAAVAVMRRLHLPPSLDSTLPDVAVQSQDFTAYLREHPNGGPLPRSLVARAGGLFDELCASAPARLRLHGDLHHDNILRATREPWLAIDPFGLVGDPGYDVGSWAYNPDPDRREDALLALVPARIEQLADGLAMPVDRVIAYAFVKAVLSEVWTAEDGGTPGSRALDIALLLQPRLS